MAFVSSSDDRLDHFERSVDELEKKVDVIYSGWEKLRKANDETDGRTGAIETHLGSVEHHLQRIAVAIEKIKSRSSPTRPHGKHISGSSNFQPQVRDFANNPEDQSFGYRRVLAAKLC